MTAVMHPPDRFVQQRSGESDGHSNNEQLKGLIFIITNLNVGKCEYVTARWTVSGNAYITRTHENERTMVYIRY